MNTPRNSVYQPPRLLRNAHLQSILASTLPRKLKVRRKARQMLSNSQDILLDCGHGVRLLGHYSPAPQARGLVILIHGWEGCSESNYILSCASHLWAAGYSVFRLNLRDHGPTHHLNPGLFNSTRLEEVLGAMEAIQAQLNYRRYFLAGFSLGGNFALRVGADAAGRAFKLERIIAVCPVISPPTTMDSLENGLFIYHDYFLKKWKNSLRKKLQHFPEHGYGGTLARLKSLREMNQYFVPNHTDFPDCASYLEAYAIDGDRLAQLQIPAFLITSSDDPVVLSRDLSRLDKSAALHIEITKHGGHCGFISNYQLDSWIDQRIFELLEQA